MLHRQHPQFQAIAGVESVWAGRMRDGISVVKSLAVL
jgi:hypothetical protein